MHINKIKLEQFRNYEKQEISFINGINLFVGDNAQGKTNIIEAIYTTAFGKSYRTGKDNELIFFGKEYATIDTYYEKKQKENNIYYYVDQQKKNINLNGIKITKTSDLIGELLIIIFSPDDLDIVKGSPVSKRKMIDSICCQISKAYLIDLQEYNKCLKMKNAYLKHNNEVEYLKVLNEKMSKLIKKIVTMRKEIVEKLQYFSVPIQNNLTNKTENIKLEYCSDFLNMNEQEIEEKLNDYIKIDIIRKISSKGIQRDDIQIYVNNIDVSTYGSQGQKRTCLLTIKIANFELLKELKQDTPILLLDDIMSELDQSRIEYLLEYIKDYQSIITTTEDHFIINHDKMKINKIKNGCLQK